MVSQLEVKAALQKEGFEIKAIAANSTSEVADAALALTARASTRSASSRAT